MALSAWFLVSALVSLVIIRILWFTALPSALNLSSDIKNLQDVGILREVALVLVDAAASQRETSWLLATWSFGFVATWCVIFFIAAIFLYRRLRVSEATIGASPPGTGWLDSALDGTLPLWKAFWGPYILLPYVVALVVGGPILLLKRFDIIAAGTAVDLIAMPLAVSAIMVVYLGSAAIAWRCSRNTSRPVWHYLARISITVYTVVPLIKSVAVLGIHLGFLA